LNVTVVTLPSDWWVLLSYRVPRLPSAPRIAVWRRLRQLGVAQLGDGLVGLPEDARTRELLEWVAEDVLAAGGETVLWRAQALARGDERSVALAMAAARAEEYRALTAAAETVLTAPGPEAPRLLKKLRRELQAVKRRDYFPPPEREDATQAVRRLTAAVNGRDVPAGAATTDRTAGARS